MQMARGVSMDRLAFLQQSRLSVKGFTSEGRVSVKFFWDDVL